MNLPKISIIVPCFNVEKYLNRCIDSILNNRYRNKEIICINDGSSDTTPHILNKYAKNNHEIQVIHQKNAGVSNARNTGLRHATGDYIMFVDPDDYVAENFIEKASEIADGDYEMMVFGHYIDFSNNNNAHVVLTKEIYNFKSGEEIKKKLFPRIYGYSLHDFNNFLEGKKFNSNFETGQVWRWIYKKSFLDKNNIRFIEKRHGEDTTFNSECLLYANSLKSINDCLYYYLPRPDGLMLSTINGKDLLIQKLNQLEERIRLGQIYSKKTDKNYLELMAGSNILSCFHLAASLAKDNDYLSFKQYVSYPEVKRSIQMVKLRFKNWKIALPFSLLKFNLYRSFFSMFYLLYKLGYQISVSGKILKR